MTWRFETNGKELKKSYVSRCCHISANRPSFVPLHCMMGDRFEMSNDGKVQDCIEGLRYYYNPKSMNILWETPIGTVLCDTCKVRDVDRIASSSRAPVWQSGLIINEAAHRLTSHNPLST